MALLSGTSAAADEVDYGDGGGRWCEGSEPTSNCRWIVGRCFKACCLFKGVLLILVAYLQLLEFIISMYSILSIFSHLGGLSHNPKQEDKLDSLLPEVKGRILEHLDHEDTFKLKPLSKNWKALIESKEFIQALSLKTKPVFTACSFFIDKGVWQWAAFDPNGNSTSEHKGKWRKLPPLTFLPSDCDPDPDLFKQFLFCANEGLVCMNFSKSTHEERLIVFNPLTEQWRELPPLLHRRNPVLMHMYVDQSSKAYHILAAGSSASGEESLSRITELYDSRTGRWERVGDLPGPAFALNEYQSGVFQNGNIFCIGFVELGDETVKGILGYNVEEGLWSTKWTAEALPNSSILQLVENNGELFLFSERDNGPLIEHWVDRIEWTPSEGDDGEKSDSWKLVNVLKKIKSGGRSLEVYPEFALVPFSESQLCLYNTVDHSGEVFAIEDQESCEALPALPESLTDYRQMFASKNRNHCRENREYCGLSSQSTQQGSTADMYSMLHNSRCVCLCPTRLLFSSLWPLYNQGDKVWPKWHHHRLLALSGNYNPLERWWKSFEILEYKSTKKSWVIVTKMPEKLLNALFQVKSFDVVHAVSHESRIIIKRVGDGHLNGVVYDLDKDTWSTDWIVPINAMAWFRGIYPVQELCVPWEKYMTNCYTYVAPERKQGRK